MNSHHTIVSPGLHSKLYKPPANIGENAELMGCFSAHESAAASFTKHGRIDYGIIFDLVTSVVTIKGIIELH